MQRERKRFEVTFNRCNNFKSHYKKRSDEFFGTERPSEIISSYEITANYRQLPIIGFHQEAGTCLLILKLGYLALVCIHLRVCYRHIATEKKQLRQPDAEFIIYRVSILTPIVRQIIAIASLAFSVSHELSLLRYYT